MKRVRMMLALVVLVALSVACGEAPEGPPRPLVDRDGDGIAAVAFGGRDCHDNNPNLPGGLEEVPGNQIDDNCNGQIDELWIKTGYWRLTTPSIPGATWDIDIQTDPNTAKQYIRCLQFKFTIKSTVTPNKSNSVTQWLTGLPSTSIPFKDNKFDWKLDDANQTIKVDFSGTVTAPTIMNGTIVVKDTSPSMNATATSAFAGRLMTTLPSDKARTEFCTRCYGTPDCTKAN